MADKSYDIELELVSMQKDVEYIKKTLDDFKILFQHNQNSNDGTYATKSELSKLRTEFLPVKLVTFGLVGIILLSVVGNWLSK